MIKDFYAKLGPKEKVLFFIALGCVFVTLVDAFVLGPILSRMKDMDAAIAAKKQTITRNLRITSFKDAILDEYREYSSYLDLGDKSQEEIIRDLLRKIEILANQQSISILNIQPGDIEENPVFQEYKTRLECQGTFNDTLTFMKSLEASDFLFMITSYSMTPKSKGGEVIRTEMDISRVFIAAEEFLPASLEAEEEAEGEALPMMGTPSATGEFSQGGPPLSLPPVPEFGEGPLRPGVESP